jgi:hypothetical protein
MGVAGRVARSREGRACSGRIETTSRPRWEPAHADPLPSGLDASGPRKLVLTTRPAIPLLDGVDGGAGGDVIRPRERTTRLELATFCLEEFDRPHLPCTGTTGRNPAIPGITVPPCLALDGSHRLRGARVARHKSCRVVHRGQASRLRRRSGLPNEASLCAQILFKMSSSQAGLSSV